MHKTAKRSTLSLRLRVIFLIIMLLVLIGGTFSFLTVRSIHVLIEEVMWENYSSYAKSFAAYSAKSFSEADIPELQRHLDIAFAQRDMIFVVAKNLDDEVVAHSGDFHDRQPFETLRDVYKDETMSVREIGVEPGGLFHSSGHTFLITCKSHLESPGTDIGQSLIRRRRIYGQLYEIDMFSFKRDTCVVIKKVCPEE